MKFVIIGRDAAGISTASRAKRIMPEMDVIVLEKQKTYPTASAECFITSRIQLALRANRAGWAVADNVCVKERSLEGVTQRINAAAVALHSQMSVKAFSETDSTDAPLFGPVWDPLLTAANQLLKKL